MGVKLIAKLVDLYKAFHLYLGHVVYGIGNGAIAWKVTNAVVVNKHLLK